MLPSLGNVTVSGKATTSVYTRVDLGPVSSHVQSSSCVQRVTERIGNDSPVLPLISEGSFTSLVSSRSNKSLQRAKEFLKKDREKHGADSKKDQDLPKLLPSHSSKQTPAALRTTQLQLNCNAKTSGGGWVTNVTNPKVMLQQAGHIQEGAVTLPNMSAAGGLRPPGPRPQPHVQLLHGKRKLQLSLARTARGGNDVHNAGFASPFAGGIALTDRYKAPYNDESSALPLSRSHHPPSVPSLDVNTSTRLPAGSQVTNHPPSVPSLDVNTPTRPPAGSHWQVTRHPPSVPTLDVNTPTRPPAGSQVTVVKFHRNYSGGNKESLVSRSSSSTFSSRQRSQDKMKIASSLRRQPERMTKPADKLLLRRQLPARGAVSMQVKKKAKKTAALLHPESTERRSRGRIMEKTRNSLKDREKGEKGSPVVLKTEEKRQQEHVTEKEAVRETEDAEEKMEVDEHQIQSVDEPREALEIPVEPSVISLTPPKPLLDRTRTPNLLKVNSEQLSRVLDIDLLSQLFRKLDSNGDGHISFEELKRSFPTQITRNQVYYLKKIYDMACESTYFGLEEFLGVQLMCKVITESSSVLSDVYSHMDLAKVEARFQTYTDLFTEADTKQTGIIGVTLLQNVLGAALNVHTDSFIVQRILSVMKKTPSDLVFNAEFLVFLPYFVSTE